MADKPRQLTPDEITDFNRSASDYQYFVFKHYQTYDEDRNLIASAPDFPYLRTFLDHFMDESMSDIVDKSRQLYVSNIGMGGFLWLFLFGRMHEMHKIVTRVGDQCYNGTRESLMGRIEFAYDHLPWYYQSGMKINKIEKSFYNPIRDITLVGDNTTNDSARGGTYSKCWIDEASFMGNKFEPLKRAALPASKKSIIVSSPNGQGAYWRFLDRVKQGLEISWRLTELDWWMRPDHNQEWFLKKTSGLTEVEIAQEYLRSHTLTQTGRVWTIDPKHIEETAKGLPDDKTIIIGGMDFGTRDDTALVLGYIGEDEELHIFYCYVSNNKNSDQHTQQMAANLASSYGITMDKAFALLNRAEIYCDPSGVNRNIATNVDTITEYQKSGLGGLRKCVRHYVKDRIRLIQKQIPKLKVFDNCLDVSANLITAHYPVNSRGEVTSVDHYAHEGKGTCNFNSHIIDAVGYLIVGLTHSPIDPHYDKQGIKAEEQRLKDIQSLSVDSMLSHKLRGIREDALRRRE